MEIGRRIGKNMYSWATYKGNPNLLMNYLANAVQEEKSIKCILWLPETLLTQREMTLKTLR